MGFEDMEVVRMAAAAAAQPIMNGVTSVLKDETGNIPADRLMHLIPLTKEVTDMFIPFFTQAMAARASQALKESGCSGEEHPLFWYRYIRRIS